MAERPPVERRELDVHGREVIELRADCSPDAGGRTPQPGDMRWTFKTPLEDGRVLFLHVGEKGRNALLAMFQAEAEDDAAELGASH